MKHCYLVFKEFIKEKVDDFFVFLFHLSRCLRASLDVGTEYFVSHDCCVEIFMIKK